MYVDGRSHLRVPHPLANSAPVPVRIHPADIEPQRSSVVSQPCVFVAHENTTQTDSETTPDDALDTAVYTAMGPNPYENDWAQPEREKNNSRSASTGVALADVAASASHKLTR